MVDCDNAVHIDFALVITRRICYNFGTYHMVIDIVNFGLNSWTPILRSLEHCIIGEDNQNVVHSDYQVVRCGLIARVVMESS